jgi:GR25 family glycosyltransferase involved in LPS biosynthesis
MNLDRDTKKWAEMQKEFKDSNIDLRRFPAIEHAVGAYGLIETFISVLKMAQDKKLENVLILEDDIYLTNGWLERWNKIKHWLHANPKVWDIYSGGAWGIILPQEVGKIDTITLYNPLISLCAHWTYVPRRTYTSLIEFLSKYKEFIKLPLLGDAFALDNLLCFYKTIISYPFIAYQKNMVSSIKRFYKKDNIKTFKNAEQALGKTRKKFRSK